MSKSAYGRVHSSKNFFLVVGCDGVARLFDIRGALGTGSLCGTVLRSRIPRASGASSVQQSAVHVRSGHSQSHSHASTAATTEHVGTATVGNARTHPISATRSPQVSHFMTHPAERRSSLGQQPHPQTQASASQPSMHNQSLNSESADASVAYDFIVHDSADDHDGPGKRRAGFRATSAGRTAGGSSGTFGGFVSKSTAGKFLLYMCAY